MSFGKHAESSVPALPDLFVIEESGARLLIGLCLECETCFFPKYHEQHRPGCKRRKVDTRLLSREGVLTSYTIQHYMPPPPFKVDSKITPYSIGLVEFCEGIQVAGILTGFPLDQLKIGLEVSTTTFKLFENAEGKAVVTWAFQPSTKS